MQEEEQEEEEEEEKEETNVGVKNQFAKMLPTLFSTIVWWPDRKDWMKNSVSRHQNYNLYGINFVSFRLLDFFSRQILNHVLWIFAGNDNLLKCNFEE